MVTAAIMYGAGEVAGNSNADQFGGLVMYKGNGFGGLWPQQKKMNFGQRSLRTTSLAPIWTWSCTSMPNTRRLKIKTHLVCHPFVFCCAGCRGAVDSSTAKCVQRRFSGTPAFPCRQFTVAPTPS
jgi:hypothetical protein